MFSLRKRRNQLILTSLIPIFFFIFHSVDIPHTIVNDVKIIREKDNRAIIDIDAVALNYLPIGMSSEDVINYLEKEGFEVYKIKPNRITDILDETLICTYNIKQLFSMLGFGDEIRIFVGIKKGKVVDTTGKVIYRSL